MTRTEICQNPFPAPQAPNTTCDSTGAAFFASHSVSFLFSKGRAFFQPHPTLPNHDFISMRDHYIGNTTTAPNDASHGPKDRMVPTRRSRTGQPGGGRRTAIRLV